MMMNIRGLIADDPTRTIYLQTLPNLVAKMPHRSSADRIRDEDPESFALQAVGEQPSRAGDGWRPRQL